MQPRSLDQVVASLASIYDPQVQSIQKQQAAIPGQVAAQEQGLQAKQQTAFGDILNGARSRGVGVAFGGIPLADQARYTADTYLPALAQLHTAQDQQASSLTDAINKINENRATQAQGIYQNEQNLAEQQRQFNENLALEKQKLAASQAAASAYGPTLGNLYGGGSPTSGTMAGVTQRADKGFNFTDAQGRPISAAAYAHATGTDFRSLLSRMASLGDQGAKQALGFVGNDYGYDPTKLNNKQVANVYNSLTWGMGRQPASYTSSIPIGTANSAGMHINVPGAQPQSNGWVNGRYQF